MGLPGVGNKYATGKWELESFSLFLVRIESPAHQKTGPRSPHPGGRLLLADIAFESQVALKIVKYTAGDKWGDEFYWLADETVPALTKANLHAVFYRISFCGGIFEITAPV